jgi:hypothetical protein
MFLEAVAHPLPHLIEFPSTFGHTDDRHVQMAVFHHRLKRRKDLLIGEVACRPEKDEGVGGERVHAMSITWPVFRGARRTGIAWQTAAYLGNPLRRVS